MMKKFFVMMILLLTVNAAYGLPSRYDLRDYGRMTSVKSQGIPGPCWAFAALGAMESNWLTQKLGKVPDLSEMQIAFYCYRDPVTSRNFTSRIKSGTLSLEGNVFMPVALMSRLSGPTDERSLPYSTTVTDSQKKTLSRKAPESFRRSMRLREAYFLSGKSTIDDTVKKTLIMNHGAIVVSIYNDLTSYRLRNGSWTYFNTEHGKTTNHDVLLAGWDDNFPRERFSPEPSRNGAWLVKNSLGPAGYFWMPYEQYMTGGAAFIVERNNNRLRHYGYDDLGFCRTVKYSWGASTFRVAGKSESLREVAFYTPANGTEYEVRVYLHGQQKPSSPADGELAASVTGVQEYAGYHTVRLPENVRLNEGEYFSVVVRLSGGNFPAELKHKGYSENAEVNAGESWFSADGVKWLDGVSVGGNACVKGFSVAR
ncbi:MAG: hypothetical protein IJR63_06620 [Synergistaceae bacterium]|nr:hypothetical protein [Synergistaceae bacterium]